MKPSEVVEERGGGFSGWKSCLFLCCGKDSRAVTLRLGGLYGGSLKLGEGPYPSCFFQKGPCQQHVPWLRPPGSSRDLPEVMSQEAV